MQVTPPHAHHQQAEKWSSHLTVWFWYWPPTPADIWPRPVPAGFHKFESGRSLKVSDDILSHYDICVTKRFMCGMEKRQTRYWRNKNSFRWTLLVRTYSKPCAYYTSNNAYQATNASAVVHLQPANRVH